MRKPNNKPVPDVDRPDIRDAVQRALANRAAGKTPKRVMPKIMMAGFDPVKLLELFVLFVDNGYAVMVSSTRDKGAISLTFFLDDEREKVYVSAGVDQNVRLTEIIDEYSGASAGEDDVPF